MNALSKAIIAETLCNDIALSKPVSKEMVENFFEELRHALESGKHVKLSGFGNFTLRDKPQRPGRNPKTGDEYFHHMKKKLVELNMHGPGKIRISRSGCLGRCGLGPCLVIYPEGIWYTYSSFADIDEIIEQYFIAHQPVIHLLLDNTNQIY
jgi:integration host factor subunit alpha